KSNVSILQLNDYCLELILKYLGMEDHLSFAETCPQFCLVFKKWARRFYINVFLVGVISVVEFKVLSLVNENIKTLCVDVDDLMNTLSKNYGNKRNYYFRKFCQLIVGMRQLQSLKVWQFENDKRQYAKSIMKMAGSLYQLKHLEIVAHSELSPYNIYNAIDLSWFFAECENAVLRPFTQLETLTLNVRLSSRELRKSCESMPNLRALHLKARVNTSSLKHIIKDGPQLEELSFCPRPKKKMLFCHQEQGKHQLQIFHAIKDRSSLVSLDYKGVISELKEAEELASIKSLKILNCRFSNPHFVRLLKDLSSLEELRISLLPNFGDISADYLELITTCTRLRLLRI
ncbi:hypothetical protein KR044_012647, partial [Drosophila immigrans]